MKPKTHFAFRVDIWDDTGDSIVEHLAGVDDFEVAEATSNPPLNQLEREESRLPIRGNPQNRICKKIAFQRSKTSKFDYLSAPAS
jgi:hypothetical protein